MLVRTEDDRKKLVAKVLELNLEKGPYLVSAERFKRDRSGAQNRLSHMWYAALGKATGEGKEYIRNYCKWTYGCPIVAAKDRHFASFYNHMINTYTYEQCVKAMQYTQVTSGGLMDTGQMAEYLNHVDAYALERGYQLPQPQDLYYEAMGYDEPANTES